MDFLDPITFPESPIYKTEDLIELLAAYRDAIVGKKLTPDPLLTEICNRIDEFPGEESDTQKGQQFAKRITSLIGGQGMAGVATYWNIRDKAQEYQKLHNISAVEIITKTIAGKNISFANHHDQLDLLDSDVPVIQKDVFKVTQFFCQTVQELGYDLFYIPRDDEYIPVESEFVWIASNKAWQAHIYEHSCQWETRPDGSQIGRSVTRNPPDQINLSFSLGTPDSEEGAYFVAEVR